MFVLRLAAWSLLLPLLLVGRLIGARRDIAHVADGDAEMERAIAEARASLPDFRRLLAAPERGMAEFSIKAKFPTSSGGGEHCWVSELEMRGTGFVGKLSNVPDDLPDLQLGSLVDVSEDMVTDWAYVQDRVYAGHFTTKALLPGMSKSMRHRVEAVYGWTNTGAAAPRAEVARSEHKPGGDASTPPLPPGTRYYQTNVKALSVGECRRFGGGVAKGGLLWLLTRFQKPTGRMALPVHYDEIEAAESEFSESMVTGLAAARIQLEALGYRPIGFQRMRRSDDPAHIDGGSVVLLSPDRRTVATVSHTIQEDARSADGVTKTTASSLIAYGEDGRNVVVTDFGKFLDPHANAVVLYVRAASPAEQEKRLAHALQRRGITARVFAGWADVRAAMEAEDLANFFYRRDARGLFVPADETAAG